jgi:predicted DNA-binding transcriptional regulator AlpA
MKKIELKLPPSVMIGSRRCFRRSEIEQLKKCLMARALNLPEPEYVAPDAESFVNASVVAGELGYSRRTMARLITESIARHNLPAPPRLKMNERHLARASEVAA